MNRQESYPVFHACSHKDRQCAPLSYYQYANGPMVTHGNHMSCAQVQGYHGAIGGLLIITGGHILSF